jgi:hypothetical protein
LTVSGLVLKFLPDIGQFLAEIKRATTNGGTVVIYIWDYAGKMDFLKHFWGVVSEFKNDADKLDEAKRFSSYTSEAFFIFLQRPVFTR